MIYYRALKIKINRIFLKIGHIFHLLSCFPIIMHHFHYNIFVLVTIFCCDQYPSCHLRRGTHQLNHNPNTKTSKKCLLYTLHIQISWIHTCSPFKLAKLSSWFLMDEETLEISESFFLCFFFCSLPSATSRYKKIIL